MLQQWNSVCHVCRCACVCTCIIASRLSGQFPVDHDQMDAEVDNDEDPVADDTAPIEREVVEREVSNG